LFQGGIRYFEFEPFQRTLRHCAGGPKQTDHPALLSASDDPHHWQAHLAVLCCRGLEPVLLSLSLAVELPGSYSLSLCRLGPSPAVPVVTGRRDNTAKSHLATSTPQIYFRIRIGIVKPKSAKRHRVNAGREAKERSEKWVNGADLLVAFAKSNNRPINPLCLSNS
jgi:hypothetical protein